MPFAVCWIVGYGWYAGCFVFDCFVRGAGYGIKTVFQILPSLIGLMAAVRVLRDSGLLSLAAVLLAPLGVLLQIPSPVLPLILVKMFSASAATGILLDLFQTYGPDSEIGLLAAVIAASAETVFFVLSVYLSHIKVQKSRWILPASLCSMMAGIAAAVIIT